MLYFAVLSVSVFADDTTATDESIADDTTATDESTADDTTADDTTADDPQEDYAPAYILAAKDIIRALRRQARPAQL